MIGWLLVKQIIRNNQEHLPGQDNVLIFQGCFLKMLKILDLDSRLIVTPFRLQFDLV